MRWTTSAPKSRSTWTTVSLLRRCRGGLRGERGSPSGSRGLPPPIIRSAVSSVSREKPPWTSRNLSLTAGSSRKYPLSGALTSVLCSSWSDFVPTARSGVYSVRSFGRAHQRDDDLRRPCPFFIRFGEHRRADCHGRAAAPPIRRDELRPSRISAEGLAPTSALCPSGSSGRRSGTGGGAARAVRKRGRRACCRRKGPGKHARHRSRSRAGHPSRPARKARPRERWTQSCPAPKKSSVSRRSGRRGAMPTLDRASDSVGPL